MTSKTDTPDTSPQTTSLVDRDENEIELSATADTADPVNETKYPAWLLDLASKLRNFRQWRLIVKPDRTLDLDYLATLVQQAQQRARDQTPTPQLNLFTLDAADAEAQTASDRTPMKSVLALSHPLADPASEPNFATPFSIIHGNNQQTCGSENSNLITLPDEILTIEAHEQLHDFLGRVANLAMDAAIVACGSTDAAVIRLGSKAPTNGANALKNPRLPLQSHQRHNLVLAPTRPRLKK